MSGKPLPHTLDNLCAADKEKVVEMLKQMNELKKRCATLEQDLTNRQVENERLSGREEVITRQLESTQTKLYDAMEQSKNSQTQIEQLTQKLQKSEAENKAIKARVRDSEAEAQRLRETANEMRLLTEKMTITTAVQCKPATIDKNLNTLDTALDLTETAVQASDAPTAVTASSAKEEKSTTFAVESTRLDTPVQRATTATDASYRSEVDAELAELISLLNPY